MCYVWCRAAKSFLIWTPCLFRRPARGYGWSSDLLILPMFLIVLEFLLLGLCLLSALAALKLDRLSQTSALCAVWKGRHSIGIAEVPCWAPKVIYRLLGLNKIFCNSRNKCFELKMQLALRKLLQKSPYFWRLRKREPAERRKKILGFHILGKASRVFSC